MKKSCGDFTLEEVCERVDYLQKELIRILSRVGVDHNKRCFELVNYSLFWLKTYTYFIQLDPNEDKEKYDSIKDKLNKQRDSIANYAVFGGRKR